MEEAGPTLEQRVLAEVYEKLVGVERGDWAAVVGLTLAALGLDDPDAAVGRVAALRVEYTEHPRLMARTILGTALTGTELPRSAYWARAQAAEARVAELEAALRGMLDVSGSIHLVIDGPNAGWVGGVDGYYDEDDVPSPDCVVCKAENAAKQVLEKGKGEK